MTIREHYLMIRRRSKKPYFMLIIFFIILITVSQTFARYTDTMNNNGVVSIAKWHIEINGEEITNSTSNLERNISLLNIDDNTTQIDSGDICYFEITIDPNLTEVAISYSILVNLTTSSNLPSGTKIMKYEKYTYANNIETLDSTTNLNTTDASISENILLPNSQMALSSTSKVKYKFYCKVPFPADFTKDDAFTVVPSISVEQYVG